MFIQARNYFIVVDDQGHVVGRHALRVHVCPARKNAGKLVRKTGTPRIDLEALAEPWTRGP